MMALLAIIFEDLLFVIAYQNFQSLSKFVKDTPAVTFFNSSFDNFFIRHPIYKIN